MPVRKKVARSADPFQTLPGVGPATAGDFRVLGVKSIADLATRDPQRLYDALCAKTRSRQDPCVLYVFRCAIYVARTRKPNSRLMQWWMWKDRELPKRRK